MRLKNSHFACSVLLLSLLLSVGIGRAALVNTDWQTAGDNLITRDTTSGLDWLDLTQTANRSYNDVSSQLGTGGQFAGFRYATQAEVTALFSQFGLPFGFTPMSNALHAGAQSFHAFFGTLVAFDTNLQAARTEGLYEPNSPTPGSHPRIGVLLTSTQGGTSTGAHLDSDANAIYGSYLVRPAILVPLPPPPGLISWWPGDADAADILDGNDGTLINGTTIVTGKVGNAFSFDGVNDFVQAPDSNLWAFGSNDFTINLWANFSTIDTGSRDQLRNVFVGYDGGGGPANKWIFFYAENGLFFHIFDLTEGIPVFLGPFVFTPVVGQFHHFAMTRNGSTYTFYADGAPIGSMLDSRPIPNAAAPLTIGQSEGIGFFHGLLDEVQIYNRALSEDEIRDIFLAGSAGLSKSDVDSDGVLDFADNCVAVSNPTQSDADGDGLGDACDPNSFAPVANNDSYSTNQNTSLTVLGTGVLGNDTDADNNSLTAVIVSNPSHAASFTLNSNGSFSYTPVTNYIGPDSFTYRANDGEKNSNVATVTITVNDITPPAITITSPAANETYQLNASVAASYACADSGSGVASCQGPVANGSPIDTSSTGTKTFTVTSTDNVGNPASASVTYSVADPTSPQVSCGASDGLWHHSNVSIACTASDPESGLANPADASFSLTTSVPPGTETANATTDSRQICNTVGGCTTAGPISGNKVDRKSPTITVTSPAANATYQLNASVAASYACADGGSGVASCQGPVANGSPIDTSSTGTKTFLVRSFDNIGNGSGVTVTYSVVSGGGGGATSADLRITLSARSRVSPGESLTYSMTVNNGGKVTATGVVVSDALPAGTVFASAAASQGTITAPPVGSNGTVTVNLGTLANGATATVSIVATVTAAAGTVLYDTATVTATTQDLNSSNNSATQRTTVSKK
jgi:uncharacterized repeat protein (TIGR01451 family)